MAKSSIRILSASSSVSFFFRVDTILPFSFCLLFIKSFALFENSSSALSAGSKSLRYSIKRLSAFSFLIDLNLHPFFVQ